LGKALGLSLRRFVIDTGANASVSVDVVSEGLSKLSNGGVTRESPLVLPESGGDLVKVLSKASRELR